MSRRLRGNVEAVVCEEVDDDREGYTMPKPLKNRCIKPFRTSFCILT